MVIASPGLPMHVWAPQSILYKLGKIEKLVVEWPVRTDVNFFLERWEQTVVLRSLCEFSNFSSISEKMNMVAPPPFPC